MKILKSGSLKHRILLLTIIVSTVMSFIFTCGSIAVDYKISVNKMDDSIENIELTTLGSLKGSLWDLNYRLIRVQLNDLLRIEGIVDIELVDESNKVIYKEIQNGATEETYFDTFEKFYPLSFLVEGESIYGGALKLKFTREFIYRDVIRRAMVTFLTQIFKTFFVSFILLYIYERYITRDLVNISKVVKEIDVSSKEKQNYFDEDRDENDEIGQIQVSIDAMAAKLAAVNLDNKQLLEQANSEKKLQEAKALSASRLASLGEMAAGIAHEINNPLTIIKGNIYSVTKKVKNNDPIKDNELINIFSKINTAVERINKIIRNMKKISRDSSLEEIHTVELKSLVEDTLDYYTEKFRKQDIDFKVNYVEGVSVLAREVELSQVLTNLLNNSNDAVLELDEKWVRLDVETAPNDVFIRVTDSGTGISEEVEQKIFDPFFTTKDIGKGTGLGLSISKEALNKMGGDLYIEKSAKNTQFVIRLNKPRLKVG